MLRSVRAQKARGVSKAEARVFTLITLPSAPPEHGPEMRAEPRAAEEPTLEVSRRPGFTVPPAPEQPRARDYARLVHGDL